MKKSKQTILGIDPSYHSLGYCLLDAETGELVKYDVLLHDKTMGLCRSLSKMSELITSVIKDNNVIAVAIEELNFSSNFNTSKSLLRVQGVIMKTVYDILSQETVQYHNVSWRAKLKIKRPKKLIDSKTKKKAYETIVENGKKVKKDIKWSTVQMINKLYNLNLTAKQHDAADSIGIATCLYNDIKVENNE